MFQADFFSKKMTTNEIILKLKIPIVELKSKILNIMSVGEAQITRLTRERLEALKKFIPVRDAFRDHLQAQQQQLVDFTTGTEQLFKPVTAVTEQVGTKVAQVGTDTTEIAKQTKRVEEILKK